MSDEHTLTLLQADQARTDSTLIEGNLEFIMGQLARVPTRIFMPDASVGDGERMGLAGCAVAAGWWGTDIRSVNVRRA
jgi:hypothetical protein